MLLLCVSKETFTYLCATNTYLFSNVCLFSEGLQMNGPHYSLFSEFESNPYLFVTFPKRHYQIIIMQYTELSCRHFTVILLYLARCNMEIAIRYPGVYQHVGVCHFPVLPELEGKIFTWSIRLALLSSSIFIYCRSNQNVFWQSLFRSTLYI